MVHLNVTPEGKRVIRKTPLAGMGLLIHTLDKLPDRQRRDILAGLRLVLKIMNIEDGGGQKA